MPRHPNEALFEGEKPFPIIPTCEHFAGTEERISKAFQLQEKMGGVYAEAKHAYERGDYLAARDYYSKINIPDDILDAIHEIERWVYPPYHPVGEE